MKTTGEDQGPDGTGAATGEPALDIPGKLEVGVHSRPDSGIGGTEGVLFAISPIILDGFRV